MPSLKDSSEPVETSTTRTPSSGRSRSAAASAITAPTALRLSLAPGTVARRPMSAIAAVAPADSAAPAPISRRTPRIDPRHTITGPMNTA